MLWLLCGPSRAMESQALVIRIKIPDGGAVDWTVHSAPQLLFRDVLVSPGGSPAAREERRVCGSVRAGRSGGENGDKTPPLWEASGAFLRNWRLCLPPSL